MKKRLKGPVIRLREQTDDNGQGRSAIVQPMKPRNTLLAHLIDDQDPEEHRRTGEKAEGLFRERNRALDCCV